MTETIKDTADRITAFISQNYTDIETGPGSVISELLIKVAAVVQNEQYNAITQLSQGNSLALAAESTVDTYSPIMDKIAANYNTTRAGGVYVTGKLKINVSARNDYFLMKDMVFTQPGLNLSYKLIKDTRVSPSPSPNVEELQLYSDQGQYYFILDVIAAEVGPSYQVPAGTVFSPALPGAISRFVSASAYGNFLSGKAKETDKELTQKIKNTLGSTRFESPAGISNRFSQQFPSFKGLSVCGANDIEMTRAKQNILGISTFGKADVYVRTSVGLEYKNITKQGTKTATNTWQIILTNTDAPGFYNVASIIPLIPGVNLAGTLVTSSVVYGHALYPTQRNNEINSTLEARFTKYQTAVIEFTYDGLPDTAVGGTADFELHLSHQQYIADLQDMLLLDDNRLACADYLIKAVVPCMVSLKINLVKKRATDTFESLGLQDLKKDLFMYINSIPFGEKLHASNIVDICHNYPISRVDLPIDMTGVILAQDGSRITLRDNDILEIPTDIAKGVSPKTTQYFIDYYRTENNTINPIDNIGLNIA